MLDAAYLAVGLICLPWIAYRFASAGARGDFSMRFGRRLGAPLERSIWLHGSSAGEVSLLKPLVALLERDFPSSPLVISAFTDTGLAAARKLYARHRVVPLPFDLSFVVRRALAHFDPQLLIIVESEFWPNLITAAARRRVPVAVVNGKMSEKSYRFHARTRLVPRVLGSVDLIAVQSDEHAARLRALGVADSLIRVTGNMKYDLTHAALGLREARELRQALGYATDDVVVIGGSVHEREDEALLEAFAAVRRSAPQAALLLVPRYPGDAANVAANARRCGYAAVLKTAVDAGTAAPPGRAGVLVVDTVGELGRLYAAADVAFVGGSLFFRGANKGGHNLMEPAILGVPVLFGPYNFSFKETVEDLLARDAGTLVRDVGGLIAALERLCGDAELRRVLGARAQAVVREGQGATQRNYELLARLLAQARERLRRATV
jgi:3-deoxy-D-manno-octulosonic-acid transferase